MKKRLIPAFPGFGSSFRRGKFLGEALAERQAKSIARKEKIRRLGVELRDASFVDAILTYYILTHFKLRFFNPMDSR